tara:strand:- start:683 stop:1300 length:618 start_codon:yes stop_codon:yes gene_type:complete
MLSRASNPLLRRVPADMEYTLRQRTSLVLEVEATAESIAAMRDAEIDHAFLLAHHISPTLIRAARITPLQLKAHGTSSVAKLAELGFGALHLLDEGWCAQCVAAYGAPNLLDEFLVTTNDAVILAASPAIAQLGINLGILLLMCAEQPAAAREVLAQYRHVRNVPPETLLETGLRARDLQSLGYSKERLREDTYATDAQLSMLGY